MIADSAALDDGWLSARELLVLQLLARGCSRAQIAALLDSAEDTVAAHERRARAAVGAPDTPAALSRAAARGLIVDAPDAPAVAREKR